MFNRGAFNRMAFNRQISVFVFGRAVADISGSAVAAATMEMTGSAVMDVNAGAAGILSVKYPLRRLWMWLSELRRILSERLPNGL